MHVLIAGCGYVGTALALALVKEGHQVSGLRRTPSPELESGGVKVLLADITDPKQLAVIGRGYDWIVNCTAAGGGEREYEAVYVTGNRNLVEWLAKVGAQAKYVYTSSTSVYGQDDGSVVDEHSPAEPIAPTGRILVQAEDLVLREGKQRGVPAVILRLAGIYGPGRGYWFKQFISGQAVIEGSGDRVLNMVHRDDVAGAIIAALQRARPGEIYNVVDDEPVTQLAFLEWLSERLGRPLPPRTAPGDVARKRGASNKRVSNCKLKRELQYQFKFPTFREGYAAEINRQSEEARRSTDTK